MFYRGGFLPPVNYPPILQKMERIMILHEAKNYPMEMLALTPLGTGDFIPEIGNEAEGDAYEAYPMPLFAFGDTDEDDDMEDEDFDDMDEEFDDDDEDEYNEDDDDDDDDDEDFEDEEDYDEYDEDDDFEYDEE
jgi:hypothetical protein